MNPETLPQQNMQQIGATGGETPQLDPSVVALTQSIGQAESGGRYNAPSGDPGSPPSAYQFTPGFIQKWGPQILGQGYDPNNLTPEQQDNLAYGVVHTMATKGDPGYSHLGKLTPAQIASAWNAGDPNAYLDPEYGKNNAYGSTENYVNEIAKNYQNNYSKLVGSSSQLAPQEQLAQQQQPKQSTWEDWVGNALGGALGFVLGHGKEVAATGLPLAGAAIGGFFTKSPLGAVAGQQIGGSIAGGLGLSDNDNPPSQKSPTEQAQANQASGELFGNYQNALSQTITGRNLLNDPQTKDAIGTASLFGLSPAIENGSMNFAPAMDKSTKTISSLSESIQGALEAEGKVAPISQAVEEAKKHLRLTTPSNEWSDGDKEIERQAQTYLKNFGDNQGNMKLGHFEQMKREQGPGKKWGVLDTSAKKQAGKALYFGARKVIENTTQHKDLYNQTMKMEQNLINARKIMKRLNGKRAPKNEGLLKQALHSGGKYASLYIGDKIGGPLGAILGSMIGEHVTRAVDKKYGSSIFETPALTKALTDLQSKSPENYERLVSELAKAKALDPEEVAKSIKPEIISSTKNKVKKEPPSKNKEEKVGWPYNKMPLTPSQKRTAKSGQLKLKGR